MRRKIALLLLVAGMLFPALAQADDIPACAGPTEITGTVITRIEQNGVLISTDGLAIRMEGIRLPNAKADRAPGSFTDQAFGMAIALTRAHAVTLTAIEPKEDRYDRLRAQVFAASTKEQVWVQKRLLELGLARVAISPDRTECARELFAIEAKARAEHRGLWASPAYAIRTPENLRGDIGTFQIVEGKIESAKIKDGRAYLNFGTDWKADLTATVSPDDMKNFDATGVDPRSYAGKTVRMRGVVQQVNGPEIEIANPQNVEIVN